MEKRGLLKKQLAPGKIYRRIGIFDGKTYFHRLKNIWELIFSDIS